MRTNMTDCRHRSLLTLIDTVCGFYACPLLTLMTMTLSHWTQRCVVMNDSKHHPPHTDAGFFR